MKKTVFLILISLTGFTCKSPQLFTLDSLPAHKLYFGSGGGFAAAWNEYLLLENGQMFHMNSLTKEKKEITAISKKEAGKIYRQLESLKITKYSLNKTGNMTYFIREVNGGNSHELKWAIEQTDVPAEIKSFYQLLQSKVSKHE